MNVNTLNAGNNTVISQVVYDMKPSFTETVRSYATRIFPDKSGPMQPGTEFNFSITSDPNAVIIPGSVCLRYTARYAPTGNVQLADNVLSSGYSNINRSRLTSTNGLQLDEQFDQNIIQDFLLSSTFSGSERVALSTMYGFNDDNANVSKTVLGASLVSAVNGAVIERNFCMPLQCAFLGSQNTAKYFPLFLFQDLRLTLVWEHNLARMVLQPAAGVTDCAAIEFTDIQLCYDSIQLTPQLTQMIMSQPQVMMKCSTWRITSQYLPANTAGTQNILINSRNSSVKSIFVLPVPDNAIEGVYGSVNPRFRRAHFIFNGSLYPQQPLEPDRRPAECFVELMKAWGSLQLSNELNGIMSQRSYCVRDLANTLYRARLTSKPNLVAGATACSKFVLGLNLETIDATASKNIFSAGLNLSQDQSYFQCEIDGALSTGYTLYFITNVDTYISIDPMTKQFAVTI